MGQVMPKFVTDRYSRFKETCSNIKRGWSAIKTIFTLMKSIDRKQDPDEFINTIKTSDAIPESYRNFISSFNPEKLRKMATMMFDTVNKKGNDLNSEVLRDETVNKITDIMYEDVDGTTGNSDEQEPSNKLLDGVEQQTTETDYIEDYSENLLEDYHETANEEPSRMSENPEETQQYEIDYIPSKAYRDILGIDLKKKESEQPRSSSKQQDAGEKTRPKPKQPFRAQDTFKSGKPPPSSQDLPPAKKMLAEELRKRFGDNWRQIIPQNMLNPNPNMQFPDLGLGLDKQSNNNMVRQMSKILKDIM